MYLCPRNQQHNFGYNLHILCCGLLSNCIFVQGINSALWCIEYLEHVVDCYQIVSLSKESTAQNASRLTINALWIAIKLYLCPRNQQHTAKCRTGKLCCGLLSNCIFVQGINSNSCHWVLVLGVVDCYQIVSLSKESTAIRMNLMELQWLWIAIKLYLCPRNQQRTTT